MHDASEMHSSFLVYLLQTDCLPAPWLMLDRAELKIDLSDISNQQCGGWFNSAMHVELSKEMIIGQKSKKANKVCLLNATEMMEKRGRKGKDKVKQLENKAMKKRREVPVEDTNADRASTKERCRRKRRSDSLQDKIEAVVISANNRPPQSIACIRRTADMDKSLSHTHSHTLFTFVTCHPSVKHIAVILSATQNTHTFSLSLSRNYLLILPLLDVLQSYT